MPIGPVVAIEISTTDAEAGYADALVAACSEAVPRGRCVLAEGEGRARDVIAIVSWQGTDRSSARVQVGVRRASGGTTWVARDMRFRDVDAPIERWRAVGLTIATLVGGLPPSPPPPASPMPAPRATQAPVRTAAIPRRAGNQDRPRAWWIEGGALLGPGLETGPWRGGGWLDGARRIGASPVLVSVGAAYAGSPTDVRGLSARWWTFSIGPIVAAGIPPADLTASVRVALSLERVGASAQLGGAEDSGSRWVPALHFAGDLAWPSGDLSVLAGGEMWVMQSATEVRVAGNAADRVPAVGGALRLGIRAPLP